jgi:hypothetical protein
MDYLGRGGATAFQGDKQKSARLLRKLLVCVDDLGGILAAHLLSLKGSQLLMTKRLHGRASIYIAREQMIVHLSSYLSSAWSIYLASRARHYGD